jgi:hypothetical protein
MADFGINPNIAMGFQGGSANKPMTLNELISMSRNVMETSRLAELYPELIREKKAQVETAETGAAKSAMDLRLSKVKAISDGQISMIMNPLIQEAEVNPNGVDRKALVNLVTQNAMMQSKNLGIDYEKEGKELARPYIEMAETNPGNLMQFFKERHMAGLDAASRATAFAEGKGVGVSTLPRRGVTPDQMTAPIQGQNMTVAPVTENQVGVSAIPGAAPAPMAQAAPMTAQAGRADAGFSLPYEPPRPGIPRATTPSEATDLATGQKYRTDLIATQTTVNKSARNVDAVLAGIKELEKDLRFTTGPLASRERYIKQFFGDEQFKQLSKDLAILELATIQASGQSMTTDAGKALVAKANGDETYPPTVLLSVANRLAGDLTRIDMEARGAQKFAQQFGDSNLPAYRQAWAANADQKIFEAMYITKNERDIKRRNEALDKLLPKSKSELNEFLNKYENIEKLTQTGRLQ